jgi:hypothetical protein
VDESANLGQPRYFETAEHNKDFIQPGERTKPSPETLEPKIAMQYFRFLPDPAKLRKEARWSGVSSVPDIGERIQPSADVGAGTGTAYFVDRVSWGAGPAGALPRRRSRFSFSRP